MRGSLVCLAALAAAALAAAPSAQNTVYVQLDYVAVGPGDEAAYLALEREVWQPAHAERRRRGQLRDWALYDVRFAPAATPYQYVVAHVFEDLGDAEGDGVRAALAAAHPGRDADALVAETMAAREVVHSELWAVVASLAPTGAERPSGRHLAVNYMAVPEAGRAEHFLVENEIWAPIHQVRADDGVMGGWAFYSLVLPRGADLPYQFGTVDFFDSLDDAAANTTDNQIRRAHPDATPDEIDAMLDRTDASRAIVRTELWTRVAQLGPPDS